MRHFVRNHIGVYNYPARLGCQADASGTKPSMRASKRLVEKDDAGMDVSCCSVWCGYVLTGRSLPPPGEMMNLNPFSRSQRLLWISGAGTSTTAQSWFPCPCPRNRLGRRDRLVWSSSKLILIDQIQRSRLSTFALGQVAGSGKWMERYGHDSRVMSSSLHVQKKLHTWRLTLHICEKMSITKGAFAMR